MNRIAKWTARGQVFARQAFFVVLGAGFWLLASPVAWAAKKKAEVEAAPTKSYTMAYIIVIFLVGIGLMVVCRPSSRADKMDDMHKKDEDSES